MNRLSHPFQVRNSWSAAAATTSPDHRDSVRPVFDKGDHCILREREVTSASLPDPRDIHHGPSPDPDELERDGIQRKEAERSGGSCHQACSGEPSGIDRQIAVRKCDLATGCFPLINRIRGFISYGPCPCEWISRTRSLHIARANDHRNDGQACEEPRTCLHFNVLSAIRGVGLAAKTVVRRTRRAVINGGRRQAAIDQQRPWAAGITRIGFASTGT